MSDIYLAIDGKQVGPYEPTLLRQYLTDGQVAAETPAWHEGLSEWSTVAEVLKKFPATATVAVPPPYIPPPPTPKPSPAPSKSEMTGCAIGTLKSRVHRARLQLRAYLTGEDAKAA